MEFGSFVKNAVSKLGLSFCWPVEWTGCDKMRDWLKLLDAIHAAYNRPEYQPAEGVTHCNQFVNEIATTLGFKELEGKMANEIVKFIAAHPQWGILPIERCQDLANGGTLIIAGISGDPHGHVNVICPGKEKLSGRWGNVPTCANVGKQNFIGRGINWAFSEMPKFWGWRQTF